MAGKSDFTPDEWQLLMTAPQMASLYISISSPSGPVGMVKEMMVVPRRITEAIQKPSGNSLIDAVAADFKTKIEKREMQEPPQMGRKPEEIKAQCLQTCRSLAWMLTAKAIPEAEGFKQWVYQVAQTSAEAAKEGGFLGFGGTRVDEAETAALQELADVLGLPAKPTTGEESR